MTDVWVLGLNAYHADAAAALMRNGKVVAAAEEERFRRVKHWAGLPTRAVAWCLEEGGLALSDVDILAVNRDPWANVARKVEHVLRHPPDPSLILDRLQNLGRMTSVVEALERELPEGGEFRGELARVEHHLAHQASSYLASPFDEAALLSVDGFGDFASTSWGRGSAREIEIDGRIYFPHSLGTFYLAMTQYLGFPRYGDEYRMMGLAAYGDPNFLEEMRRVVRGRDDGTFELDVRYFLHQRRNLEHRWDEGRPSVDVHFSPELVALLGPSRDPEEELTDRHCDLARSVQVRFEECLLDLLRMVHDLHPVEAVCLSGGAAMNAVANGKVIRETPFEEVYVPPAPGDAGGAVGAALWATWEHQPPEHQPTVLGSYFGSRFGAEDYESALAENRDRLEESGCGVRRHGDEATLCEIVAREIASGKVVGWFQGRMEFGPRALGNRSILCDPRREEMRDAINDRVKLRDSFRPFAPSVLREHMADWFAVDDDSPFMMKVYPVKEEKRGRVPAVTHVDGTSRPQTVTREQNPLFHRLLTCFHDRTNVPMVLNTSFNENEPIIHRPEEAVDCFLRTDMDLLILGQHVLWKAMGSLGVPGNPVPVKKLNVP